MKSKNGIDFDLLERKIKASLEIYASSSAMQLEAYAKDNASWTDRTGNARQGLQGGSVPIPNGQRIYIAHGMDYGIYLENCNEGKYAIIDKTIDANAMEIMQGLRNLLE